MWPVENSIHDIVWLNVKEMSYVSTQYQPPGSPQDRDIPLEAPTSGDEPPRAAAQYLYRSSMQLLARDREILNLVSRFSQLSSGHIDALIFSELASRTPCSNALRRLTGLGLLHRVNQMLPGGARGGSQRYCYALGPNAWRMYSSTRYRPQRTLNPHTLAIADAYVAIKQAEREKWVDVLTYGTEPDSWIDVAGADLRPDLYVELGLREKRERVVLWLEVDMGSERQKQILEKVDRYKYALEHSAEYPLDVFPSVLFLACDEARADELRTILRRAPQTPEGFISVALLSSFPQILR